MVRVPAKLSLMLQNLLLIDASWKQLSQTFPLILMISISFSPDFQFSFSNSSFGLIKSPPAIPLYQYCNRADRYMTPFLFAFPLSILLLERFYPNRFLKYVSKIYFWAFVYEVLKVDYLFCSYLFTCHFFEHLVPFIIFILSSWNANFMDVGFLRLFSIALLIFISSISLWSLISLST